MVHALAPAETGELHPRYVHLAKRSGEPWLYAWDATDPKVSELPWTARAYPVLRKAWGLGRIRPLGELLNPEVAQSEASSGLVEFGVPPRAARQMARTVLAGCSPDGIEPLEVERPPPGAGLKRAWKWLEDHYFRSPGGPGDSGGFG